MNMESSPSTSKWHELPSVLLIAILECLLPSIPDVLTFSAVCTSWRQALATASHPLSGPPLLLCSNKPPKNRNQLPIPSSMRLLKSLTPYRRPLESKISDRTLNKTCIGNSHGHLIFTNNRYAVVVDVFTGKKYHSPRLPCVYSCFFDVAILTEPPTASSCVLLLAPLNDAGSCSQILYWRLSSNAENWSVLQLDIIDQSIHSLRVFEGSVYGLLSDARVLVLDFDAEGRMHCRLLSGFRLPTDAPNLLVDYNDGQSLVEWDGKHLLVRLVEVQGNMISGNEDIFLPARIDNYRLNLSERTWVAVQNIGDWCLFVNVRGRCTHACSDPARWGVEGNRVCITTHRFGDWTVLPLGDVFDADIIWFSSIQWASPLWVFPSKLM